MPSDKRARQRAAREARLAAEARARKRRGQMRTGGIVAVVAAVVVGIVFLVSGSSPKPVAGKSGNQTTTTLVGASSNAKLQREANALAVKAHCPASPTARVNTQTYSAAPAMTIDTNDLYSATIKTTAGTFTVALNAKSTPQTVNNFVFLARKGYYNCNIFQRVIPGFMDQTGDPTGTGTGFPKGTTPSAGQIGAPGYTIPDELPAKAANPSDQYPLGSVVMANRGTANTGGSQFFIVDGATGESLAPTYSLFGRVVTGQSVVNTINLQGNSSPSANGTPPEVIERILSVTINQSAGL